MALNQWLVGAPLPTSGSGKIGAGLVGNLELVFSYFKNYGGDQQDRVIALLYCIFFGGLFLVFSFRKIINIKIISRSEYYLATASLLVGVFLLLNSLFLFSLVPFWNQGYWYYFPMIFISAFLIACFIACIGQFFNSIGYILYFLALVLILNISFFNRLATQPPSKYALVTSLLWKQKNYIRNTLENYLGNFKIIDTYDGAFGYLLNVPTRSITGLISSPSEILKSNDFWGNAIKDGFNVVPIAENSYIQPDFYKENNLTISNKVKFDGVPIEFYFIDKK